MEETVLPKDDHREVIYADDIDYLDTWKVSNSTLSMLEEVWQQPDDGRGFLRVLTAFLPP